MLYMGIECERKWDVEYQPLKIWRSSSNIFMPNFQKKYVTSEAHGTSGTIDHILCPEHLLSSFSNCTVVVNDPINLSDHDTTYARHSCCVEVTPPHTVSTSKDRGFILNQSMLSRFALNAGYTAAVDSCIHWFSIPDLGTLMESPKLIIYCNQLPISFYHLPLNMCQVNNFCLTLSLLGPRS